MVRKNTLPYIHPWSVIDRNTQTKIGEYKTEKLANEACDSFEKFGLPTRNIANHPPKSNNAFDAADYRMKHSEGDMPLKPSKHSNKRPVELD